MTANRSPMLSFRARGSFACFTRPELKVERVSYAIMTPSAARGILEAIVWKPAIQWIVDRIKVLKEIRFTSFRRNELNSKATTPTKDIIANGGTIIHFFIEDDRSQRNTIALFDVDYIVESHFILTDKAGEEDNMNKFIDIFKRRIEKGQHFHQPYLGCREFPAIITPVNHAPEPISDNRDLGLMLWDIEYSDKKKKPVFFSAHLCNGIMEIPEDPHSTLNYTEKGDLS